MNNKNKSERGQALVIIAAAIMGLVGMVGLAVDGGMAFSDRRQAQNAADAAAAAGALAKVMPKYDGDGNLIPWTNIARDRAGDNGYTGDILHSEVFVYTCYDTPTDCADPYTDDPDYIQVIILSHVDTFFARVVGIPQLHNRVQAVYLAKTNTTELLLPDHEISALAPACDGAQDGTLILGGSGDITLTGGGLFVNSADEDCGLKCTSTSLSISIEEGGVLSSGSPVDDSTTNAIGSDCDTDLPADRTIDPEAAFDYPNDLPRIDEPEECTNDADHWGSYSNDDVNQITYLYPGYYGAFPPKKVQATGDLYDRVIMKHGIYCVGETVKLSDRHLILESEDYDETNPNSTPLDGEYGVNIFIRPGYGFRLENGTFHLTAGTNYDPLKNFLFFVSPPIDEDGYPLEGYPDTWGSPEACVINGGADDVFTGGIYAPFCALKIDGSSGTIGLTAQVVGYTVDITGGAGLTLEYDPNRVPVVQKPAKIGTTK